MADTIEDLLGQSRANATNEERVVLALEAIADHLASLVRPPPAEKPELLDEIASSKDSDFGAEAAFENEGGRLGPDLVEDLGITHSVIDQYTVGKYHYTSLDNAIAQAQRLRERPEP